MKKTIETKNSKDFYEDCLDLETAGELMNGAVAKIMRKIYDEEEKEKPDEKILQELDRIHEEIEDDRRSMRGEKPEVVKKMIKKYSKT